MHLTLKSLFRNDIKLHKNHCYDHVYNSKRYPPTESYHEVDHLFMASITRRLCLFTIQYTGLGKASQQGKKERGKRAEEGGGTKSLLPPHSRLSMPNSNTNWKKLRQDHNKRL